jgi:glycosyltransferase involved in cell wall biosynthesis
MKTYPFAVISPRLGTRSETFIHRHMTELLPGKTAVVARTQEFESADFNFQFPYLILGQRKRNWHWLYWGSLHFFKMSPLTPIQVRVEQYLRRHGVQIILSEFLNASLKWLYVARKLGVRFFAHAHGHDVSAVLRDPVMQRRYRYLEKADGIITMSDYSRDKLVRLGLSGDKIHVIPYGVDVPRDCPGRGSNGTVKCLSVGRMVAKKSPLQTLEAFRLALLKNPNMRLDYVGDGVLGDDAKKFVQSHGLQDKVILHGSQPHRIVQEFLQKAHIFIQHSQTDPLSGDEEGLPVAILEAMANGLPVISTRHAGIPEAVGDGVTGFLVDEGDVEGMATQILKLADDQDMRRLFGQSGWQRARRRYSWEAEKNALFDVLGLEKLI